jgi:hypothetical protein
MSFSWKKANNAVLSNHYQMVKETCRSNLAGLGGPDDLAPNPEPFVELKI